MSVAAHNSKLDAHGIYLAQGTITHAQIILLHSTDVVLAGPVPPGYVIQFLGGEFLFTVDTANGGGGTGYTLSSHLLQISYAAGQSILTSAVGAPITTVGWLDQTNDAVMISAPQQPTQRITQSTVTSATANKLVLWATDATELGGGAAAGAISGGNASNILRYKLLYRLIPVTIPA